MLTFIMLARLATLCPAPVLQRVDRLIEPLKATCTAKVCPAPPHPTLPHPTPPHPAWALDCLAGLVTSHCTVCTVVVC